LDAPLCDARSRNENETPQHEHELEKARGNHMMMAKSNEILPNISNLCDKLQ